MSSEPDDGETDLMSNTNIEPRDMRFDLSDVPYAWHGGQLSVTLYFDTLSIFFPAGERFFVKSVKQYRDDVADPRLLADVAAFCAHHFN